MYVPGDCNILLICVCDLQCYRKKKKERYLLPLQAFNNNLSHVLIKIRGRTS